jgi:hypothetical protein
MGYSQHRMDTPTQNRVKNSRPFPPTTTMLLNFLQDTLFFWSNNDNGRSVQYGGRIISLRLVRAPSGHVVANLVNGTTIHLNGTDPELTIMAVTSASITPLLHGVQFNSDSPINTAAGVAGAVVVVPAATTGRAQHRSYEPRHAHAHGRGARPQSTLHGHLYPGPRQSSGGHHGPDYFPTPTTTRHAGTPTIIAYERQHHHLQPHLGHSQSQCLGYGRTHHYSHVTTDDQSHGPNNETSPIAMANSDVVEAALINNIEDAS